MSENEKNLNGFDFIEEVIASVEPESFNPPINSDEWWFLETLFSKIEIDYQWYTKLKGRWDKDGEDPSIEEFCDLIRNILTESKELTVPEPRQIAKRLTILLVKNFIEDVVDVIDPDGKIVLQDASLKTLAAINNAI